MYNQYTSFKVFDDSPTKIKAKPQQLLAIDEAIRTAGFCRNKALRYWMDNRGVDGY